MDNNKDIGNAFKERLGKMQKSPSKMVWDNIVAELDKKEEKKKSLIIWWKIAGVAAVFLLLFTIGYKIIPSKNGNKKQQIITESGHSKKDSLKNKDFTVTNNNSKENLQKTVVKSKNNLSNSNVKKRNFQNNKVIVEQITKQYTNTFQKENLITSNKKTDTENKIGTSKIPNKDKILNTTIKNDTENTIATNNKIIKKQNKTIEKENLKIENKLTNNKDELDLLKEVNKEDEKSKLKKKWQIAIKGAPVFYSSLSNGSSLDNNLKDNSKSGDITVSYGISVSYPISKKIKIRIGINNVNLAYKTEQVSVVTVLNSQALNNINIDSFVNDVTTESGIFFDSNEIDLTQKIDYFEIPLELKYNLFDKKININLITGFSTLILNDDFIIANNITNLGSVNNLKEVSFTGNLGFEFDVKLTKKLHFNLEPNVKLQFNTYKNNVDYKPYFFGVYSGFSYQF